MGRIQSSTGLVTGFDIQGTVAKLMTIEAQPRDVLVSRQKAVQAEQGAIVDLTALTLGVQLAIQRLKTGDLFGATTVTSSNPSILTATTTASAAPGQYQFVPARIATANHALSSGVASVDDPLGAGAFSFRFGGHVDTSAKLSDLNGGAGVARGRFKITDRSGAVATIDLRYAKTIDDVIAAIANATDISVSARADGDKLVLTDHSGGSGNLRVQEVGTGTTAAGLGLAGINVAANIASGQELVSLFSGLRLDQLRDGNGLSLRPALDDLNVTFQDGTSLNIDLDPVGQPTPKTLGDIISRINAADPTRLAALISADGLRIELQDLTTGAGTFAVTSPSGGRVAEELGLTGPAVGGSIMGARIASGLKTTLLGSLDGGQGLGALGLLSLTDRSGASANVNLAAAETLDDVIGAINGAGLGIVASYNAARNGIALTDTTGATTSNLIAANGDGTNTATELGLAASVAGTSINSGSLNRQVVSRGTLLTSYNGGQGVSSGTFKITNSNGVAANINLTALSAETVGDVIDAINALAIGVTARINDAGDGISLVDTAGGGSTLSVTDQGTGQAAADLHLAGSAVGTTIDGSTTFTIQIAGSDSLDTLITKINALGVGVAASALNDGDGSLPVHLSLLSSVTGKAGQLLIDGSGLGLSFQDLTTAQDALLQVGASSNASALVSSASNTIANIVPGLSLTLAGTSVDPVTVTVAETADDAASAIQIFVDQYNKLRDKLETYTAFNPKDFTTGMLFGSSVALHLDSDLSRAISGSYFNDGSIRSLAELGVSIDETGKLSFDKTIFEDRFAFDAEAIIEFFTDEQRGFAVTADAILESLVGEDDSLLVTRAESLQRRLDQYAQDIKNWNSRLSKIEGRLLNEFFLLESIVGSMKNNLTAISQIQYIPPIFRGGTAS